jgi:translation initiation factor 1
MRNTNAGGLVYSTDGGRMCPACRQPVGACACRAPAAAAAGRGDGIVRVSRRTQGRGGRTVTLCEGIDGDAARLAALAKALRTLCGSGGTVKGGAIEIQGDHCERVIDYLRTAGLRVKRSGG